MSESPAPELPDDESASIGNDLPPNEHLPPVEPPSAGFIVQLFLIPALIVAAIIGVWLLFGKMASNKEDVARVLVDLQSSNSNRRGPAMHTFTQILLSDSQKEADRQEFVNNTSVAASAAKTLEYWLQNVPSARQEKVNTLNSQIFLSKALGQFNLPKLVLPALRKAMHVQPEPYSGDQTEQEIRHLQQQVRNAALESIAIIADRASKRNEAIQDPELINEIIEVTNAPDVDPELQHRGAFVLGFLPSDLSTGHLLAWLRNADDKTRLNAAISLARQDSTEGYDVFASVFKDALTTVDPEKVAGKTPDEKKRTANRLNFERWVAVKNALTAIGQLNELLTEPQRTDLIALIAPIARDFKYSDTRKSAQKVLDTLKK